MPGPNFHWRYGWHFQRQDDGSVKFWNDDMKVLVQHVPASEWASIIASVAQGGENAFSFETAMQFHQGLSPK